MTTSNQLTVALAQIAPVCLDRDKTIWKILIYPKSLGLHGGGKRMRPHELSLLSAMSVAEWGE